MNLKNNHLTQLLTDALDSLKLTEKNRRIAEPYLESAQGADSSADGTSDSLEQVEEQDFALLGVSGQEACLDWCQALRDEKEEELLGRYVQFVAAVGGSSAVCVLVRYKNENWLLRWLTKEQRAAFWAEMYAHEANTLQQGRLSVLFSAGQKDPEVLIQAMELCRGSEDAPKMLLAGIWLCCMSLDTVKNKQTEVLSGWLEQRLLERLPELFAGNALTDAERSELQDYVLHTYGDTPFPAEIRKILRGRTSSADRLALLTGCAYLSLGHRESFQTALKLLAAADQEAGRSCFPGICRYMADADWFNRHRKFLLEELPISPADWARWGIRERLDDIWKMVFTKYPSAIAEVTKSLSLWQYDNLLQTARRQALALHEKIYEQEKYRQKAAEELVTNFESNEEVARKYFLGEAELSEILPCVKEWRKDASGYYGYKNDRLELLRDDPKMQKLYRRAVAMEGLLMHGSYFRFYMFRLEEFGRSELLTVQEIGSIFQIFQEEQVPVSYQLDTLASIHECYHKAQDQDAFQKECVEALDQRISVWGEEYKKAALNGAAMTRIFCILTMDRHGQEYKDALFACAGDGSRQVQQVLLSVYGGHREWEQEVKTMLASRKQKERQMAVWVLKQWGVEQYRPELEKALQKEKNKKISEYLQKLLGAEQETVDLEQLAGDCLKNGGRQKVQWAFQKPYEKIHTKGGMEVAEDYLKAIMACYAFMDVPGISKDAGRLADALEQAELSACMRDLFFRWLETGAEAKKKWVLYAASIHGGEAMIPLLHQQIKELPGKFRGALAVEAVKALTLNGTSAALLVVDQISRKFKYRQVKKGAADALAGAALQLGISREDLEDRIVPDLGFDERMEQKFDYGSRSFTVRLTLSLEAEVYDADGKRLKNLPSPKKQDDPEQAEAANLAFKQLKKQLKTVAAGQKLRLEQALIAGRYWQAAGWKELFVKNPVMHQFAAGLIWGVYEDGRLKATFRYMEDGSFNTREEEPFAFPEQGTIGLVHPVELSEEERAAWAEQLSDYEITQPVEQLARTIFRPTEEEQSRMELSRFKGNVVNALSLSGKLTRFGWNKGPVGDNGEYDTFYREDGKTGVRLFFSGCGITGENTEVVVYDAVFYRPDTDTDQKGGEENGVPGEVSPRYFSEIVLQLVQAAGKEQ